MLAKEVRDGIIEDLLKLAPQALNKAYVQALRVIHDEGLLVVATLAGVTLESDDVRSYEQIKAHFAELHHISATDKNKTNVIGLVFDIRDKLPLELDSAKLMNRRVKTLSQGVILRYAPLEFPFIIAAIFGNIDFIQNNVVDVTDNIRPTLLAIGLYLGNMALVTRIDCELSQHHVVAAGLSGNQGALEHVWARPDVLQSARNRNLYQYATGFPVDRIQVAIDTLLDKNIWPISSGNQSSRTLSIVEFCRKPYPQGVQALITKFYFDRISVSRSGDDSSDTENCWLQITLDDLRCALKEAYQLSHKTKTQADKQLYLACANVIRDALYHISFKERFWGAITFHSYHKTRFSNPLVLESRRPLIGRMSDSDDSVTSRGCLPLLFRWCGANTTDAMFDGQVLAALVSPELTHGNGSEQVGRKKNGT